MLGIKLASGFIGVLGIMTGTIGNIAIIAAVVGSKRLHKQTFIFIANLAVADLIVITLCMPLNLIGGVFMDGWELGTIACKVTVLLVYSSLTESCFSLVLISWHRFVMIAFPLKIKTNIFPKKKVALAIAVTWIASVAIAIPQTIVSRTETSVINNRTFDSCEQRWPKESSRRASWTFAISFYVFIILNLLCAYILIAYKLNKRKSPGRSVNNEATRERGKWRTVRMILVVVIVFVVSWSPYMITKVVSVNAAPGKHPPYILNTVFILLGCLNSVVNPIIYALMNIRMRKALASILCAWTYCYKRKQEVNLRMERTESKCEVAILKTPHAITNALYFRSTISGSKSIRKMDAQTNKQTSKTNAQINNITLQGKKDHTPPSIDP